MNGSEHIGTGCAVAASRTHHGRRNAESCRPQPSDAILPLQGKTIMKSTRIIPCILLTGFLVTSCLPSLGNATPGESRDAAPMPVVEVDPEASKIECRLPLLDGMGEITDTSEMFAIPPAIDDGQVLYENERAIVYVSRRQLLSYLDHPPLGWQRDFSDIKQKVEQGSRVSERDLYDLYPFIDDSIRMANIAVYDKSEGSNVAALILRHFSWNYDVDASGGYTIVYLADCTELLVLEAWIS